MICLGDEVRKRFSHAFSRPHERRTALFFAIALHFVCASDDHRMCFGMRFGDDVRKRFSHAFSRHHKRRTALFFTIALHPVCASDDHRTCFGGNVRKRGSCVFAFSRATPHHKAVSARVTRIFFFPVGHSPFLRAAQSLFARPRAADAGRHFAAHRPASLFRFRLRFSVTVFRICGVNCISFYHSRIGFATPNLRQAFSPRAKKV